jgi:Fe-S cluster assembly ATP-binding protein
MKQSHLLSIQHIHASIEDKHILQDVSLDIKSGEVHAVMGPNGSGKSTLAHVLMGHPSYVVDVQAGSIQVDGENIITYEPEQRAKKGIFLAFQAPIAVPGVTVINLLRTAYQELHKKESVEPNTVHNPVLQRRWRAGDMNIAEFTSMVRSYCAQLHIDEVFLGRSIHDGFSGGEKKKIEMLQALVLKPAFAFFDEIDTGLDVDALKIVAKGISLLTEQGTGVVIITHYQRILSHIHPDKVHILVKGKLIASGGQELAGEIEKQGYKRFLKDQT